MDLPARVGYAHTARWKCGRAAVHEREILRQTFQVPPGTRIDYRFDLVRCLDPDCQATRRINVIWAGVITMGRLDRTITVTHTFRRPPNSSTNEARSDPAPPAFGIASLPFAALIGLGGGARRYARRDRP